MENEDGYSARTRRATRDRAITAAPKTNSSRAATASVIDCSPLLPVVASVLVCVVVGVVIGAGLEVVFCGAGEVVAVVGGVVGAASTVMVNVVEAV